MHTDNHGIDKRVYLTKKGNVLVNRHESTHYFLENFQNIVLESAIFLFIIPL